MNTKSFNAGFAAMDSIVTAVSAVKRGIVHAAKSAAQGVQTSAQTTKNGVLATSEAVTSFFAGMKQAVRCHRGTCKLIPHKQEG